jgi:uncharacterized peroxidase-related enzyme
MARVRNISSSELAPKTREVYERYASAYGPFANQVAVFAHVPPAVDHLMTMLMELRAAQTLPRRYLEIAIVVVSQVNACHYCVAHHKPMLVVEGLTPAGVDRLLDYAEHPELTDTDRLVIEYAIQVTRAPRKVGDALFERLRAHFSEAQIVELTLRITLTAFFNSFSEALQIDEEQPGHAAEAAQ